MKKMLKWVGIVFGVLMGAGGETGCSQIALAKAGLYTPEAAHLGRG